jgi:glycosyltransferase involved in cell wall biosynthesis
MKKMTSQKNTTVTLCTYTYNDKNLLVGLLKDVEHWTVKPDEIIIIDDGSDVPLTLDTAPDNCRIVRLDSNMGLCHAKNLGPNLATSNYILSVDCDTRISPDWLKICLPHAEKEEVGIVGGVLVQDAGDDIISRYLMHFGDNHNADINGFVDFIPGNARLMRSDIWRHIAGLTGHTRKICEDRFLCTKLNYLGYKLYIEKLALASQVRKLSRQAMIKRFFNWNYLAHISNMPPENEFTDYVFFELILVFLKFYVYALNLNEPIFIYLNFIDMTYTISNVMKYATANLGHSTEFETSWKYSVYKYLSPFPSLQNLIINDAFSDDFSNLSLKFDHKIDSRWSRCFDALRPLSKPGGVWERMERDGVSRIRSEDESVQHDFSFHLEYEPE